VKGATLCQKGRWRILITAMLGSFDLALAEPVAHYPCHPAAKRQPHNSMGTLLLFITGTRRNVITLRILSLAAKCSGVSLASLKWLDNDQNKKPPNNQRDAINH
jgi:hypothetical protein